MQPDPRNGRQHDRRRRHLRAHGDEIKDSTKTLTPTLTPTTQQVVSRTPLTPTSGKKQVYSSHVLQKTHHAVRTSLITNDHAPIQGAGARHSQNKEVRKLGNDLARVIPLLRCSWRDRSGAPKIKTNQRTELHSFLPRESPGSFRPTICHKPSPHPKRTIGYVYVSLRLLSLIQAVCLSR